MVIELTSQNIITVLYLAVNCFIAGDYHGSQRPWIQDKAELITHYISIMVLILIGFEMHIIFYLIDWIVGLILFVECWYNIYFTKRLNNIELERLESINTAEIPAKKGTFKYWMYKRIINKVNKMNSYEPPQRETSKKD
jgi:hypothetical protein